MNAFTMKYSFLFICGLAECTDSMRFSSRLVPDLPPLERPNRGRTAIAPASFKFRLALIDFADQTGAAKELVWIIPDMLATEIHETQRYDIYDRGELRNKKLDETVDNYRSRGVDGLLVGSITKISHQAREIDIELRMINAKSYALMYARRLTLHYKDGTSPSVDLADLKSLAEEIKNLVPKPEDARIVALNGTELILNVGEEHRVKKGMSFLIKARLDSRFDQASAMNLDPLYVIGEAYVISVDEKISHARLSEKFCLPDSKPPQCYYPLVTIDDIVVFK